MSPARADERCGKGHPRTPENTYIRPDGQRDCVPCRLARNREWYARTRKRPPKPTPPPPNPSGLCLCGCGLPSPLASQNDKRRGWVRGEPVRFISGHNTAGAPPSRTHGQSDSPTYSSWTSMWTRCTNPNRENWPYYGGRGITVCDRWRSFSAFLADMGERPDGLSLDRVDPDGNYEPANCRWATRLEQTHNRRGRAA